MLLGDHLGPVFGRVATTTFFAFVILEQCFCRNSLEMRRLMMPTRWGKYTYGLYLLHPLAIHLTSHAPAPPAARALAALVLSMTFAWASYEAYETWFLRFGRRYSYVGR
jgi:peptidoglycan/LPS O-acetylase OafA/YrhL